MSRCRRTNLAAPILPTLARSILVIEGRPRDVGTITVARVLPSPKRRMVGPFIFLDHLGPVVLAPGVGSTSARIPTSGCRP